MVNKGNKVERSLMLKSCVMILKTSLLIYIYFLLSPCTYTRFCAYAHRGGERIKFAEFVYCPVFNFYRLMFGLFLVLGFGYLPDAFEKPHTFARVPRNRVSPSR